MNLIRLRSRSKSLTLVTMCVLGLGLSACQSVPTRPPIVAPQVDLPRFMGDWYVIANIPTFLEAGAHNAMDHYVLQQDGTVATTYTYRADSFEGKEKSIRSIGYVLDSSNAVWGQQYIWPIKADYRIAYVSADYSHTIIAREKRDYVWIMARTPKLADADYLGLVKRVGDLGYDIRLLEKAPQK